MGWHQLGLFSHSSCSLHAVLANSVPLDIPADCHSLNETLGAKPKAAHIDWQVYRPKYGNSVEISSGMQSQLSTCHLPVR